MPGFHMSLLVRPCLLQSRSLIHTRTLSGHSERRTLFHETSELVALKTKAALDASLKVILCVGETLAEREDEKTTEVVNSQLQAVVDVLKDAAYWRYVFPTFPVRHELRIPLCSKIVIAYEPVWAIGTGKVATAAQAQDAHAEIRQFLKTQVSGSVAETTRIIYGGSVTAANAKELCACIPTLVALVVNSPGFG